MGGLLRFFGYSDVEAELDEWGGHFGNESTPQCRVHVISNIFDINVDHTIFSKLHNIIKLDQTKSFNRKISQP